MKSPLETRRTCERKTRQHVTQDSTARTLEKLPVHPTWRGFCVSPQRRPYKAALCCFILDQQPWSATSATHNTSQQDQRHSADYANCTATNRREATQEASREHSGTSVGSLQLRHALSLTWGTVQRASMTPAPAKIPTPTPTLLRTRMKEPPKRRQTTQLQSKHPRSQAYSPVVHCS